MTLPTFIIVGAPRSGTTSLYAYLKQHPQVGMSLLKEPNYFAFDPSQPEETEIEGWFSVRTLEEYAAQFAHAEGKAAVGEASSVYLGTPGVAARIHALLPEARIVAILRDPVDRAYSGYVKWLKETNRKLDLPADFAPDAEWIRPDSHWVKTGFYARLLRDYLNRFGRGRVRIYLHEDLITAPRDLLRDLQDFIGVGPHPYGDLSAHNRGSIPRSRLVGTVLRSRWLRGARAWAPAWAENLGRRVQAADLEAPPPLPPAIRRRLETVYRESVLDLQDLLRRDLSHWLAGGHGRVS